MKKNIQLSILCWLLLFTSVELFSQVNSYFLHNPVWKVKSSCSVPDNCLRNDFYNYYTKGDTLINSLVYKKLYKKGYITHTDKWNSYSPNCPSTYNYHDTTQPRFLRSAGKQIFILSNGSNGEQLLYDFNLQIGDTLPNTQNNWGPTTTVVAIDSIYTPYGHRKRFQLSSFKNLIEGIGHSNGLLEPIGPMLECAYWLECFSLNDTTYFPANASSCAITVGIVSHKKEIVVSVFPNPFNTFTTIQLNTILKTAQLNVYNQYGQKTKTIENISGDKIRIERDGLISGVYFYQLIENNRSVLTGKLMLVD